MALQKESDVHISRRRSNMMLGLVLGGFVVLVFAITIAKMMDGTMGERFDHVLRPQMIDITE